MQFRDLQTQYETLQPQISEAIESVVKSGIYIGGPEVAALEKELADYVGVGYCITCANGTDALQLALMAWGIGPNDAVIVPDFTFFSSGEVVSALGATPVFVDVLEGTFNLDPNQIVPACERAREQGLEPKAVIAVDLFGLPADYSAISAECERLGLLLLEDGAQGFGGQIGDRKACSFGDISTTSFFPAKPLGCYGDGGAVFTDSEEWANLIRSYAVHGKGSMKYDNVRIGMNSRLDAIQAAILRVKLKAFAEYEVEAVNERASWYDDLLSNSGLCLPKVPDGYKSSWAQYTVVLPDEIDRVVLQESLRSLGIPAMVYYPKPMHEQVAFNSEFSAVFLDCSVTTRLCGAVLSLPMGPYLSAKACRVVCDALIGTLAQV